MEERKISELIKKYNISDTDKIVAEDEDGTKALVFGVVKTAILEQLSCNTINDLKSLSVSEGLLIHTLGYNKVNDGGAGTYIIVYDPTKPDDGGLYHYVRTTDVLRAELVHDGTINVKQFGAVGDGVYDDYNAIQKAIDTGLNVVIPNGKYKISCPLKLHSNTKIDFNNSTIICPNSQAFVIGNDEKANNILIENAVINGSAAATITDNASQIIIKNIHYSGNGYITSDNAFYITSCKNITLDTCSVEYFSGKSIDIYIASNYVDAGNSINIRNCQLSSKANNVVDISTFCDSIINIEISNCSISCGDIDHNCINVYGVNKCNISNCNFTGGKYNIYQNGGSTTILSDANIANCGQIIKLNSSVDMAVLCGLAIVHDSTNTLPLFPTNPGTVKINGIIKNNTNRSQK